MLPCLVILWRCLPQCVQQLQAGVPFLVQQSAEGLQSYYQQATPSFRADTLCCHAQGSVSKVEYFLLLVKALLQAGSHSAELTAAGRVWSIDMAQLLLVHDLYGILTLLS